MARKPADPIDGAPLAVGMATLLRQFHPSYMRLVRERWTVGRHVC